MVFTAYMYISLILKRLVCIILLSRFNLTSSFVVRYKLLILRSSGGHFISFYYFGNIVHYQTDSLIFFFDIPRFILLPFWCIPLFYLSLESCFLLFQNILLLFTSYSSELCQLNSIFVYISSIPISYSFPMNNQVPYFQTRLSMCEDIERAILVHFDNLVHCHHKLAQQGNKWTVNRIRPVRDINDTLWKAIAETSFEYKYSYACHMMTRYSFQAIDTNGATYGSAVHNVYAKTLLK